MKLDNSKNKTIKEKKCYYCKSVITKNTNLCPFCNKKQLTHKVIQFSLIAVALGLITFILIISRDVLTYGINSIIIINNIEYKVTSVDDAIELSSWMGKPKEGYKFILISLLIKNNNSEDIDYVKEYWSLRKNNGDIIKSSEFDINLESLNNSKISNIKSEAKVLIFEVPINDNDNYLLYEDNETPRNTFQIKLF